ncbi:hypothetical protein BC829DRAFT_423986 [Chytridium lagenaria]|nr:hypothetical protein BC829DRAFT_423986 [Chytridium lagenaria]
MLFMRISALQNLRVREKKSLCTKNIQSAKRSENQTIVEDPNTHRPIQLSDTSLKPPLSAAQRLQLLERESWKHLDKERLICPICCQSGVKWTNKGPSGSPSATGTRRFSIRCDGSSTGSPCGHSGRLVNILLKQQDSDYLDIGHQIAEAHQQLDVLSRSESAALRQPKKRPSTSPAPTKNSIGSSSSQSILSHFSPSPSPIIPSPLDGTSAPSPPIDTFQTPPPTINLPLSSTPAAPQPTSHPSTLHTGHITSSQSRLSAFSYHRSRDFLTNHTNIDTVDTMSSSFKKTGSSSSSFIAPTSQYDQAALLEQMARMNTRFDSLMDEIQGLRADNARLQQRLEAKDAEINRLTRQPPAPPVEAGLSTFPPLLPGSRRPVPKTFSENFDVNKPRQPSGPVSFAAAARHVARGDATPEHAARIVFRSTYPRSTIPGITNLYMRGFAEPGPLRYTIIRNALLTLGIESGVLDMSFIGKSVVHLLCDSSKADFIQTRLTNKGVFLPNFNPLEVPELVVSSSKSKEEREKEGRKKLH